MSKPFAAMESALNCYGATFRDLPARATRSRSKMHSAAAADLETARDAVRVIEWFLDESANNESSSDDADTMGEAQTRFRRFLAKVNQQ